MRSIAQWIGVAIGLVAVLALTLAVFGLPVHESLSLLWDGALGDRFGVYRTIVKACPLVLVALGLMLAWRAGMFNIGGEGQLITGALAGAATFRLFPEVPGPILNIMILASCSAAGGAFAGLSAWMYARRGVNVVISTILLNFVAITALNYFVRGPLQEPTRSIPQTDTLSVEAMFVRLDPQSDLHAGVFVALIACVVLWVFLQLTRSGFRLRLVGSNPFAARAARIDPTAMQVKALIASGALCGLAGGVEYVGVAGYLSDGFSPGWGFLAIPVALIGGLHPIGVLAAGMFFGALIAGSKNLEAFGHGHSSIILAMQGIAVLGFVMLQEWVRRRRERVRAV